MSDKGTWITLNREITDHWIWKDAVYLKAWLQILISVNHQAKPVLIDSELLPCDRGQKLYSIETWTGKFGKDWSRQRLRTFFKLLEKDGMIKLEGLRKTTRLTVCKYNTYQLGQPTDNQQITNRKPSDNQQITTIEERIRTTKNEKNDKEDIEFDKFWDIYDHKYNKGTCHKLWARITKKNKALIFEHLKLYIPNNDFKLYPDKYLRKEAWFNEVNNKPQPTPEQTFPEYVSLDTRSPEEIKSFNDKYAAIMKKDKQRAADGFY